MKWWVVFKGLLLRYRYPILIISAIIGVCIGIVLISIGKLTDTSDRIQYFGFTGTAFSIILAAFQYRSTHDWNRRQCAIEAAVKVSNELKEAKCLMMLNRHFDYLHRSKTNNVSPHEIHKKICKLDENGELLHDKNDNLIEDHDCEHGKEVKEALKCLFNSYEFLGAGVSNQVYDIDIIDTLFRTRVIKAYNVFNEYIDHYNDMHKDSDGRIWKNFFWLAKKFIEKQEAELKEKDRKAEKEKNRQRT